MTDPRYIDHAVHIDPDHVLTQMRTLLRRAATRPATTEDTQRMYALVAQMDAWSSAGGYPPGLWQADEKARKLARRRTWRQTTCGQCRMYITGNPRDPNGAWWDSYGYTQQPPSGGNRSHSHYPREAVTGCPLQ